MKSEPTGHILFKHIQDVEGKDIEITLQMKDGILDRWVQCKCARVIPDPRPDKEGKYLLCYSDEPVQNSPNPPRITFNEDT